MGSTDTIVIGVLAIPAVVGVAMLRYRLCDIDIIINRALVYDSITLMLALVYFRGVTRLRPSLRRPPANKSSRS